MFTVMLHGLQSVIRRGGMTVNIGGRDYPVVQIGNQLWLAENLDYVWNGLYVGADMSSTEPRGNYYNNDKSTYGYIGLLYNGPAIQYLNSHTDLIAGFHVPSQDEWTELILYAKLGGTNTDANTHLAALSYGGSDDFGFGMIASGFRKGDWNFTQFNQAYFCTSNVYQNYRMTHVISQWAPEGGIGFDTYYSECQYPIRLVKDV